METSKLLVISDGANELQDLFAILQASAWDCSSITYDDSTLQQVRTLQPDLLLLSMAQTAVAQFCHHLQTVAAVRDIPVIFVIDVGELAQRKDGLISGAADYLISPFQAEEIAAKVGTQLKLRHLNQHFEQQNTALRKAFEAHRQAENALQQGQAGPVPNRSDCRQTEPQIQPQSLFPLLNDVIAARIEATKAKDLLTSIFERMHDGIVALDTEWRYVYVNDNAGKLLGRPAAELIGKHIWTEFPDGVGQPFYQAYHRAVDQQTTVYLEEYYEPWDRWFENRIYPDANGLTIYFTEITDRKQAETERLQAEQVRQELTLLEQILDVILAGYWDWDIPGNQEYLSPGFKRMFGYADHELANTPDTWQALIFPDDLAKVLVCFEQHVQSHGQIPYYNEVRYRHKDGSTVWVMCSGKVIEWDEAGNPLRMIGCHVDISDRKRAETALRESERRYAALAKSAPVGIFRNDVNGSLIYANERWSEITGLTLAEGLGDRWLTCVHPNWRDRLVSEWEAIIEEGSHHYVESCLQMPDGSLKWVYCQAQPEKDASGQVVGYVGSLTDVTTLVQTRQLLAEQTAQLKATVQELESFSYSVSHDLRAPLRHIHGFANALRQQLEPHSVIANPKVAHYLKVIDESSLKLGRLIDGLLTLSRVGRRQLTYELVNTRQLVQQAIDLLSSDRPAAAKAEFVLGDLPIVRGDAVLLQQVFSNLLNNALKFSRSVPAPRIIVDSLADDTLFVRDNGVGFEMAYADQLFGPFQRLHSQREFEGTGIGLAIVQRIIHRHGGTIWAESQSGQGATFYFTLQRPIPPH